MRRQAILEALHRRISTGQAVLAAGCSAGIIARSAEEGGADLIVVYSTGRSRLMGLPTWRFGDSNRDTLAMSAEILNVVSDTPVIGGIEANDPTRRDLGGLLDRFESAGFAGVINFPTLTNMPDQRRRARMVGYGFRREVEAVRLARSRGMFTMAYVASTDDAAEMASAGADCVVTHSGPTTGGRVGYSDERSVEVVCAYAQSLIDAAVAENPEVIPLLHGGRLSTPDDVREALPLTTAVGFVGASSIERIPVERAVRNTVRAFQGPVSGSEHARGAGPLRVVVTGGAGRSGTVIAAHLRSAGAEVLTADLIAPQGGDAGSHIGSHLVADLADLGETVELLRGADAVLHLAGVWAQGVRTPATTFHANVQTTFNVFEAAAIAGTRRVVWASTQSVVGTPWGPDNLPDYLPIDESLRARPRGTYALSKHVGEQIGPYFAQVRDLEVVGLRLAWMIHQYGWGVVPVWQEDPLSRRFNAFVYVDVRDVATACAAALEAPLGDGAHVLNIGAADTCMDIPSAELAALAFGGVPLRRPLDGYETLVSIRAARDLIGYRPRFSWRDHLPLR